MGTATAGPSGLRFDYAAAIGRVIFFRVSVEKALKDGDQVLELSDGRVLGWRRYGHAAGRPLLYFHGWPGSRLEAEAFDRQAKDRRVSVIAVDRPGYGLSGPQPGRSMTDWPIDVAELADALGLTRFAVVGVSGGGPYAAVCAWRIPERLSSVGIVCGLGPVEGAGSTRGMTPLNRALLSMARRVPSLGGLIFDPFARVLRRRPEIVVSPRLTAFLPEVDRRTLRDPSARRALTQSIREAFRQGPAAARHDGLLYARPWGFPLEEISIEVQLWHGELDRNVPVAMGRALARRIPRCRAHFLPQEGHMSLPFRRAVEILDQLID